MNNDAWDRDQTASSTMLVDMAYNFELPVDNRQRGKELTDTHYVRPNLDTAFIFSGTNDLKFFRRPFHDALFGEFFDRLHDP